METESSIHLNILVHPLERIKEDLYTKEGDHFTMKYSREMRFARVCGLGISMNQFSFIILPWRRWRSCCWWYYRQNTAWHDILKGAPMCVMLNRGISNLVQNSIHIPQNSLANSATTQYFIANLRAAKCGRESVQGIMRQRRPECYAQLITGSSSGRKEKEHGMNGWLFVGRCGIYLFPCSLGLNNKSVQPVTKQPRHRGEWILTTRISQFIIDIFCAARSVQRSETNSNWVGEKETLRN